MMPNTLLHRVADWILRAGIRLAPGDAREWGNAMLGELYSIEGSWAALAWSLGGAGVLAKQALIALLLPARNRRAAPVGNPLAREAKMHKASLLVGGACLAAVLLFFLAPVFRQAFRVSLAQWQSVIHADPNQGYRQPEIESFARRVEKNRDPEGMAFVAVRLHDGAESVQLADEAVRLDPKLTWVLGIVGGRFSTASSVPGWVQKLEQWDPGNAVPYLIVAQRKDLQDINDGSFFHHPQPNAAWVDAMARAFNSNRIDDYTEQLQALDRKVAQRYKLSDPYYLVESGIRARLPSYALVNLFRYAKLTMASGDKLEAGGNAKGAVEEYLQVAHFVHMLDAFNDYPLFVDRIMPGLYTRLAAAYKKMGNDPQSAYFAGLASTAEHELGQRRLAWRSRMENQGGIFGVTPWNALVVELADAAMLLSGFLLLVAFMIVLAKSRSLKPQKLRMGPVTTGLGFLGAVGLLVSSVTLYVAYRPYAAIYTHFLQTGDASQLGILRNLIESTRTPIGTQIYRFTPGPLGPAFFGPYVSTVDFTFYFWLAITVLGVATLAVLGGRHLLKRFRPRAGNGPNAEMAGL